MPYRRLPNTDAARLRALKIAFVKGKELPPFQLAFSQATFTRLQTFLSQFEHAQLVHKSAFNSQISKSQQYINSLKKAKLYISHFIQVINMAIARGDMPSNVRLFYGLDGYENKVPSLNTEAEVIKWGEAIINGETERTRKGAAPVTNPTIALVKVRFEDFKETFNFQKTLQKNNARTLHELARLRKNADELIVTIWNEVEETFKDLPDSERRENAKAYGLVYVFRKSELRKVAANAFEEEVEDEDVMPEIIEGFKQEESVSESEPEPEQEESGSVEAVTPEPEKPKTVKSQSKPKGNFPIQTELNF
ncbi:MAG: hypothetical protein Q8928_18495 [Bacteroidota bacterium]|nr:hypothetical protein [Bacteroidota bacterium]